MKSGQAEEINKTVGTGRGRIMAPVMAWLTYQRSHVFSQNICAGFFPGASPRISTWVPVSRGVCPLLPTIGELGMPFLDRLCPLLQVWAPGTRLRRNQTPQLRVQLRSDTFLRGQTAESTDGGGTVRQDLV